MRPYLYLSCFWVLSFAFLYVFYFRYMTRHPLILSANVIYFLPLPFWSPAGLTWLWGHFLGFFRDPLGLCPPLLGAGLFIAGVIAYTKENIQRAVLFLAPILLVLAASGLRKYPVCARSILFFAPALCLFTAQGLVFVAGCFHKQARTAQTVLLICVLICPVGQAGARIWHGRERENIRPVMQALRTEYTEEDLVFINDMGLEAFCYYLGYYRFNRQDQGLRAFCG